MKVAIWTYAPGIFELRAGGTVTGTLLGGIRQQDVTLEALAEIESYAQLQGYTVLLKASDNAASAVPAQS